MRRLALLFGLVIALAVLARWQWSTGDERPALPPFTVESRPLQDRFLLDYAGILGHYREGAEAYLLRLRQRFGIEAMVVTVPDIGEAASIDTLAADIVNGWEIGRKNNNRGLLLLLADREQQVRLEVSYELEDVFTDVFSGHVEDLQLQSYVGEGDVGTGLVAVMEEIEQRARIKRQQHYTAETIAALDGALLSGGAGARRNLAGYAAEKRPEPDTAAPLAGASSADEAWQILLAKWSGNGRHIDKNIYTEMTRMAMGDPDDPDRRTREAVRDWLDADYEVIRDRDHAVIWFGNREGWNFAPFLFCRTPDGWQFDIVHQRRLVVMAENPRWQVEQGDFPYVQLLTGARQSTGKDLPLPAGDLYRCRDDREIAARIKRLEDDYRRDPDDFATVMALARLRIITDQRPNRVLPLLERAKQLDSRAADPYRYAAIYHVNAFLQYETALREIDTYISLTPGDPFGYQVKGFLLYRLGRYGESIDAFDKALSRSPDSVYTLGYLVRNHVMRYNRANRLDPRRHAYLDRARTTLARAEALAPVNSARIANLKEWMARRDVP